MSIVITDYDPAWPVQFLKLKGNIETGLGDIVVAIEHVGSTAVPGLAAKPVIDMDVVVERENIDKVICGLALLGYMHQGDLGIADREAFTSPDNGIAHHLYLVTPDNHEFKRHILFRDYLRAHPGEAQAYAVIKRSLAQMHVSGRTAYSNAKTEFVEEILRRAER